jgi:hypothetical protein
MELAPDKNKWHALLLMVLTFGSNNRARIKFFGRSDMRWPYNGLEFEDLFLQSPKFYILNYL